MIYENGMIICCSIIFSFLISLVDYFQHKLDNLHINVGTDTDIEEITGMADEIAKNAGKNDIYFSALHLFLLFIQNLLLVFLFTFHFFGFHRFRCRNCCWGVQCDEDPEQQSHNL